jgi:hypothetical protein
MSADDCITLSIEPLHGKAFQYGLHLGTQIDLARRIAAEKFRPDQHRTLALLRGGRVIDCFDGAWASDRDAAD